MSLGQRLSQDATLPGAHLPSLSTAHLLQPLPAPSSRRFCPTAGLGLCCSLCPECPLLALPRAVPSSSVTLRNAPVIAFATAATLAHLDAPSKP